MMEKLVHQPTCCLAAARGGERDDAFAKSHVWLLYSSPRQHIIMCCSVLSAGWEFFFGILRGCQYLPISEPWEQTFTTTKGGMRKSFHVLPTSPTIYYIVRQVCVMATVLPSRSIGCRPTSSARKSGANIEHLTSFTCCFVHSLMFPSVCHPNLPSRSSSVSFLFVPFVCL